MLLLLSLIIVLPLAVYADRQAVAFDVVACVNSQNGYPREIDDAPWEPEQAILEVPYEHERTRLAPDYYLVYGRRLGWHGTWAALLYLGEDGWFAFETRSQEENSARFASNFVPDAVIEAFMKCGAEWSEHWTKEYPVVNVAPSRQPPIPLVSEPFWNDENLLPPKRID